MIQTTIMLVVFAALFTGSFDARADSENPFGFETNKHPLEYDYCKKEPGILRGHGYTCSSAPRSHPDLEVYKLQFVEDVGLCLIVGRRFLNADNLKINLGNFKSQIASKYGPPTAGWKQRLFPFEFPNKYAWDPKAGFKGLGDVKAIRLMLDIVADNLMDAADNDYEIVATVHFWLVTIDACQKKIAEKANNAF